MYINKPIISISIVNYNSSEYLIGCLKSILRYSEGLDIEILIVDNASIDFETSLIYKIFPDAIITCNEKNMGFAYAQNQNFKLSNSDYFFLLNPDTLITEGCLQEIIETFNHFDDVAIVGPNLISIEGKDMNTVKNFPTIKSAVLELLLINNILSLFKKEKVNDSSVYEGSFKEMNCVDGAAFAVRSDIYKLLNGLDERYFMYFEETDFCKRVKDMHMKIYFLPNVYVYHLYGRSSINTDVRQTIYYESYFQYFQKHCGILLPVIIRALILLSVIIRIFGIQIKYFPFVKGWSMYFKKMQSSLKLLFWALGIQSLRKSVG
jgi:GT2 family glycosyltransferase